MVPGKAHIASWRRIPALPRQWRDKCLRNRNHHPDIEFRLRRPEWGWGSKRSRYSAGRNVKEQRACHTRTDPARLRQLLRLVCAGRLAALATTYAEFGASLGLRLEPDRQFERARSVSQSYVGTEQALHLDGERHRS